MVQLIIMTIILIVLLIMQLLGRCVNVAERYIATILR